MTTRVHGRTRVVFTFFTQDKRICIPTRAPGPACTPWYNIVTLSYTIRCTATARSYDSALRRVQPTGLSRRSTLRYQVERYSVALECIRSVDVVGLWPYRTRKDRLPGRTTDRAWAALRYRLGGRRRTGSIVSTRSTLERACQSSIVRLFGSATLGRLNLSSRVRAYSSRTRILQRIKPYSLSTERSRK